MIFSLVFIILASFWRGFESIFSEFYIYFDMEFLKDGNKG